MKNGRRKDASRDSLYRAQFEEEALPYLDAVYNFAFGLTRDRVVAEDLVQETFLRAFRGFRNYKIGTRCKAWLFKICKNLFIDQFRSRARSPLQAQAETLELASVDPPLDTRILEEGGIGNEQVYADLFGDEIYRHLAELPDEFREALLLCDLEELSYEEISKVMDTPIGTVRSRISRARSFLRERLERYAQEFRFFRDRTPEDRLIEDKLLEGSSHEHVQECEDERSTAGGNGYEPASNRSRENADQSGRRRRRHAAVHQ